MTDGSGTSRVALVSGAGRGIGRAIALRLGADGHAVAVNDIDAEAARAVAEELADAGARAEAFAADVSRADEVAAMCGSVARALGRPQILVNNAGVITVSRFRDLTETAWDRVLAVNLKAAFLCSRAVLGGMVAGRWGRIVNIASDAARTGEPWIAHYCASKFGLIGLTQSLALEHAADGITVNAVCPAISATDMMERLAADLARLGVADDASAARAAMTAEMPMGRPVAPEEVADMVSFLAAERSRFVSGQALNVSGAHEVH